MSKGLDALKELKPLELHGHRNQGEWYGQDITIGDTEQYRIIEEILKPKKVVFNVKDTVYVGCADCPTCGATIDRDDESGLINFCQYCGQALDWEVEENA